MSQREQIRRQLDYLCLQPTVEGQASYAHVNEIVAGLRRRGWHVRLIEVPHPAPGPGGGIRRAIAAVWTQLRYWRQCRFRPARFVYIRSHFLALPTAALARAGGSIVLQEVNGAIDDAYAAWPQLRPLRLLVSFSLVTQFRWADAVIAVTPGLAGYVAEVTGRPGNYPVIGNGADVDRFKPMSAAAATDRPQYIVFVGALAPWQGIGVAIDAVQAAAWPPDVDLVIAGDGMERDRVQLAAQANPHVRWLGKVPYSEVPGLLAGSIAALVPITDSPHARYGTSKLKMFEAMACGVPVVASDLASIRDVVDAHDCGVTFAAGDPDALARAVTGLVEDPVLASQMGSRGRAAAVAEYSWDKRASQTEEVLSQLAGTRRGKRRSRRPRRDAR
jgi:glycosyltransferase involved in cell wall biosynthesis